MAAVKKFIIDSAEKIAEKINDIQNLCDGYVYILISNIILCLFTIHIYLSVYEALPFFDCIFALMYFLEFNMIVNSILRIKSENRRK